MRTHHWLTTPPQLVGALSAAVLLSGVTACSDGGPAPEETAGDLASAFSNGSLPAALFRDGSPQKAYDAVVEGLTEGDVQPDVTVDEVTEEGETAEATLTWSWPLEDGATWSYESTVPLARTESGWQADWAPSLVEPSLEDEESLDVVSILPARGDILGARGTHLVTERPVVRFGIDKTRVSTVRALASAEQAAVLLGVDPGPFVKSVRTAGDRAFVEAIVLRPDDAAAVPPTYDELPGAVRVEDRLPLAPTREFAAAILGRVGPATAELVEESDGRLGAGDVVGLSGLEARYDEQLSGTPGVLVEAVDPDGGTRTLFRSAPVDGEPLRTTLDAALQGRAERVLAGVTDVPAALVAIRPSTGALLAAAGSPGAEGLDIATYGQYAPGSTFKIVSSLALLRAGVSPEDPVSCPPRVVVDGKQFENYDDYPSDRIGTITLREAVAYSCNTAFIGLRSDLDDQALQEAAASLGLGVDHDLGFPAYFGQVPPATTETERAADLIGQGKILASPMVMAAVAASVAAGRTVVPYLLPDQRPDAHPTVPLAPEEAQALADLMRAVVTVGSGALLAGLPGDVGAKTGTAEYGEPLGDGSLPTHAWMIAFRDDLAVAVFVETGASGSSTAGPLLEAFLS